jgi:D-ornithine 4,5-aminomutase subunit alpha
MMDERIAAFSKRQAELKKLSDTEIKKRFWALCNQVVEPIIDLARTHTSPSIERSVLLRMGIDSISTHGVVTRIMEAGLLGKGAGNVVFRVSEKTGKDLREAARMIIDDKNILNGLF